MQESDGGEVPLPRRSCRPLPAPERVVGGSDAYRAGTIDAAALHMAEGTMIRDVVRFQKDLGLQAIANGEFRRTCFSLQLDGGKEAGGTKVRFHQHSKALE